MKMHTSVKQCHANLLSSTASMGEEESKIWDPSTDHFNTGIEMILFSIVLPESKVLKPQNCTLKVLQRKELKEEPHPDDPVPFDSEVLGTSEHLLLSIAHDEFYFLTKKKKNQRNCLPEILTMILFHGSQGEVRALFKGCFLLLWLESGWERDGLCMDLIKRNLSRAIPSHKIMMDITGTNATPKDVAKLPLVIGDSKLSRHDSNLLLPLKDYLYLDAQAVKCSFYFL